MADFSKQPPSWKIIMESVTGNVIISEVNALMYVILSKAKEHVPYGELVGTKEGVTPQPGCRTNRSCYKRVQLYSSVETRQHQ